MTPDPDLLAIRRGLVVAPAGCGKTHAIVSALQRHQARKPILVLTHTNAGVAALRRRLRVRNVPSSAYRLTTLDGWAMRLVGTFPKSSGVPESEVSRKPDYPRIREKAGRLIASGHIARILRASYERMIIDEYQDCSIRQHRMVTSAASFLPTIALGDPLQAIFAFGQRDLLPDWTEDVCRFFPLCGELREPWRWRNAGNEALGIWLAAVRESLLKGQAIDLSSKPDCVDWVRLWGRSTDHAIRINAARCPKRKSDQTALVIGDSESKGSRHQIAKSVPGVTTVEPVDLKPLIEFAARLESEHGQELLAALEFGSRVMTKVRKAELLKRLDVLKSGRFRKGPDGVEEAARRLREAPAPSVVADLLEAYVRCRGSRVYRPGIFWPSIRALRMSRPGPNGLSCVEAAIKVREERRGLGRRLPKHGIGSTLLLKGLEADHAVVLNAHNLDAKNLYVALTRASRTVTVCSPSKIIAPKPG